MKSIILTLFILVSSILKSQTIVSFNSAGNQDQYVPVVFQPLSSNSFRTFTISRPSVHDNRDWLAHGLASITAVGYGWGSQGNSIRLDNFNVGFENANPGSKKISFVGRVVVDFSTNNIVVFLRGGTTYYTDGIVIRNDGSFQDAAGQQNFSAASINDPLYNLPKGSFYSDFEINAKTSVFTVRENGNVGIGISSPQNKLDVNGIIHAKEIKVDLNNWADYVFTKDYLLPDLEEVEKHIQEKGHLPGIPSEKEVLENGISLGENQKLLLQKIEELTLYSIEQNKKLRSQSEQLNKQSKEIQQQSDLIQTLQQENSVLKSLMERIEKLERSSKE